MLDSSFGCFWFRRMNRSYACDGKWNGCFFIEPIVIILDDVLFFVCELQMGDGLNQLEAIIKCETGCINSHILGSSSGPFQGAILGIKTQVIGFHVKDWVVINYGGLRVVLIEHVYSNIIGNNKIVYIFIHPHNCSPALWYYYNINPGKILSHITLCRIYLNAFVISLFVKQCSSSLSWFKLVWKKYLHELRILYIDFTLIIIFYLYFKLSCLLRCNCLPMQIALCH